MVLAVVACVGFLALWFVLFFVAALVDEDVNHWNWPSNDGPGWAASLRMAAISGLISAAVVGIIWWLIAR